MKASTKISLTAMFILFLFSTAALADNITIYDGNGTGTGWHGAQEDQEVEISCVTNQTWDLEGFFTNGNSLTMIGGFDFRSGQENISPAIFSLNSTMPPILDLQTTLMGIEL